jgi:hypothetical protein
MSLAWMIATLFYSVIIYRTNWQLEVEKAHKRNAIDAPILPSSESSSNDDYNGHVPLTGDDHTTSSLATRRKTNVGPINGTCLFCDTARCLSTILLFFF